MSDKLADGTPKAVLATEGIRWWGWSGSIALMALLPLLAALPPYVSMEWRFLLMQAFAPVCHQVAERSFHVDGVAFAACHRCYGVYLGLFLGPVLYLGLRRWERRYMRHSRAFVALGLLPMAIDWSLYFVPILENTPVSRTLTGVVFGLTAAVLVTQALASRPMRR